MVRARRPLLPFPCCAAVGLNKLPRLPAATMALRLVLFLLLLAVPLAAPAASSSSTSLQSVHYQSWLELLNPATTADWVRWRNTTKSTTLEGVSNSDDLFQALALPFGFPFLGADRFVAFVGANGYVQFDSTNSPPCISQISYGTSNVFVCFQSSFTYQGRIYTNDFNNSYYGMIAAFAADLYPPSHYPASSVSWNKFNSSSTSGVDTVDIHYRYVPFYNFSMSRVNNTFHVRLRSDGSTTILYEDVHYSTCTANRQIRNYDGKCYDSFIVGLRSYVSPELSGFLRQSDAQKQVQSKVWRTKVQGVYPPSVSLIKSQTIFHACPFSDSWCMTPKLVTPPAQQQQQQQQQQQVVAEPPSYVNLTTLSLSCADKFSAFKCSFAYASSKLTSTAALVPVSGGSKPAAGASSNIPRTFTCQIPANVLSQPGNWTVDLLGTVVKTLPTSTFVPGDSSVATPVPVSTLDVSLLPPAQSQAQATYALVLRVLASGTSLSAAQSAACAATAPLVSASSLTGMAKCNSSGSTCSACTTSGADCVLDSGAVSCGSVNYLKMCDKRCHSPAPAADTMLDQSMFWPVLASCCQEDQLDCAGECKGGKVVARRYSADELGRLSNVCCTGALDCNGYCGHSNAPQLDCNGVCGGKATIDGCGVCSGGTTGKAVTTCELKFAFGDQRLNASIPYVGPSQWDASSSGLVYRNVTLHNTAHVTLSVLAKLPQSPQLDPAVNFVTVSGSKRTVSSASQRELIMAANSTMTITVVISLQRVFQGKVGKWIDKQINFEYAPSASANKKTTMGTLDVQIVVPNCASIADRKLCMAAPFCMWCQSSAKGAGPLYSSSKSKSAGGRRELFNMIAPDAVEPNFEAADGEGFCSSGYDPAVACAPYERLFTDDQVTMSESTANSFVVALALVLGPVVSLLYLATFSPWSHLF